MTKFLLRVIFFLSCLFVCLACQAAASQAAETSLKKIDTNTRVTTDGNVIIDEYSYNFSTMGGDGGFAELGSDLLLGTSEGRFFRIKDDLTVEKADIPPLETGFKEFQSQKHYTTVEKEPRLHDIVFYDGTLYASCDCYDAEAQRIRFMLKVLDPTSRTWKVAYRSPPVDTDYYAMGSGGRMVVNGKYIYVTIGDYSLDRKNGLPTDLAAQNKKLPFGKVNRFDPAKGKMRIYAYGLRNPLGISWDGDGPIVTDNGPRGGDAIVHAKEGANYGWPNLSLGRHYENFNKFKNRTFAESVAIKTEKLLSGDKNEYHFPYTAPDFSFVPSVAPTQIIRLQNFFNGWDGDYLIGSLKARKLYRAHREDGRFIYAEPIMVGQRIRDIIQHNGKIWMLADSNNILTLSINRLGTPYADITGPLRGCTNCHTIDRDRRAPTPNAPNLYGVYGRAKGSTGYTEYSAAMKKAGGIWDHDSLFAFLLAPQSVVPGTAMPTLPASISEKDVEGIIDELKKLKDAK